MTRRAERAGRDSVGAAGWLVASLRQREPSSVGTSRKAETVTIAGKLGDALRRGA